ncbi:hypothetical protein ACHAWF_009456 [Thalassiosira exigua]
MSSLQALLDAQERRKGSSSGGGGGGRPGDGGGRPPPPSPRGSGRWGGGGGGSRSARAREWQPPPPPGGRRDDASRSDRSRGGGGPSSFDRREGGSGGGGGGSGSGRWGGLSSSTSTSSPRGRARDGDGSDSASGRRSAEPTYEERRADIERRAVEESRRACAAADEGGRSGRRDAGGRADRSEDDIESLSSWVGPLVDGGCTYYQDRDKRFPFRTDERGYDLLRELMTTNRALLQLNHEMLEDKAANDAASSEYDPKDVLVRIGQGLYAHKPTLRTKGVTWSTEEYSHPGLQRMYLRMKSIQRFTEVWCLLERSAALGTFDDVVERCRAGEPGRKVRVAAVGGGPGYELLATKLFFARRAPEVELELICMDLCPAWRPYAERLGFRFVEYDINEEGGDPVRAAGMEPGQIDFVIVSCVMIYCTNAAVLGMFRRLLHDDGVKAILISERGERTRACTMMEELGGKVIRLIDQSGGMDERQAIWCSPAFCDEQLRTCTPDYEGHQRESVFPNVPYCEHKERRSAGEKAEDMALHPSSVASKSMGSFSSKYLVYHERVKTTRVYIRDATPVSPYALILFGGGSIQVEGGGIESVIWMDGWLGFKCPRRDHELLMELRGVLDGIMRKKIENPLGYEFCSDAVGIITAVKAILEMDEDGKAVSRVFQQQDTGGTALERPMNKQSNGGGGKSRKKKGGGGGNGRSSR